MTRLSSRASSAGLRARSGASPCAARSAARGHRAGAVRRERRAVPDDLLPDLPPPRRRDRAHRGGRRSRALEPARGRGRRAGRVAAIGDGGAARGPARARGRAAWPRRRGVARARHRRLEPPGRPQVPARARRVRPRAAGVPARRAHPRRGRAALAAERCCSEGASGGYLGSGGVTADVESARRDWEDAYRRLQEAPATRRGAKACGSSSGR